MMKLVLILLLLAGGMPSFCQRQGQTLIDSLVAALPSMKEDTAKVKAYNRISQIYYSVNPTMSFPYADKGLRLAEKLNWKRGIANMHNNLGLYISDTGNFALGIKHYLQSYALNKELGSKQNQINNLNNIGRNYQFESDFTKAATYFFNALSIAEALKSDEHIALVGTNLTSCFFKQANYPKATEYALITLTHARLAGNSLHEINALMQLGSINLQTGDTLPARAYLDSAKQICEETKNYSDLAKVLLNLAVTMYPDYQLAIGMMQRVDSIIKIINPRSETEQINSYNLAESYHHLAQQTSGKQKTGYLKKAAFWLSNAKTIAGDDRPENTANILLLQSDLDEEAGNYKASLANFKRSKSIVDSIFSQEKKNELAGLEGKHRLAVKDNEIALNRLTLANQRKVQWGMLVGLALSAVIAVLLYRQSQTRKKNNNTLTLLNRQLDEANKTKARFFSILSHDLRSPIVSLMHFLELQRDSPDLLNEKQSLAYRTNISESAENVLHTMEAMLLWSKEQMENFTPVIQNVQVTEVFENIRKAFPREEKVSLSFSSSPGMTVVTDPNYLLTIMQNLTSNAVRALRNTNSPTISWEAKEQEGKTEFSITDNGPGIDHDRVKVLFEEHGVANGRTGLGFHLIRDLAKAIHYKISVHSQAGGGTTFVLSSRQEPTV